VVVVFADPLILFRCYVTCSSCLDLIESEDFGTIQDLSLAKGLPNWRCARAVLADRLLIGCRRCLYRRSIVFDWVDLKRVKAYLFLKSLRVRVVVTTPAHNFMFTSVSQLCLGLGVTSSASVILLRSAVSLRRPTRLVLVLAMALRLLLKNS